MAIDPASLSAPASVPHVIRSLLRQQANERPSKRAIAEQASALVGRPVRVQFVTHAAYRLGIPTVS